MVIEWLKVKVPVEQREFYIQKDAEVWNPFLAKCPGFISKETWINPEQPEEVVLMIRWASRAQWESVPADELKQVEAQFLQVLGTDYPIVEMKQYQVRKFPVS